MTTTNNNNNNNNNKSECGTFAAGHRWVHSTQDLRQRGMSSSDIKSNKSNSNISDGDNTDKINNKFIQHGPYFTDFTARKAILYIVASLYVIGCGLASMAELFLNLPCDNKSDPSDPEHKILIFPNPAYDGSYCPYIRHTILLGMNKTECSFGRRLVSSIIFGGLIGWERRQADRPAGIRTMSLVSLGSCLFTINSTYAFMNGPMTWDASRISAAIPSGVGFLGAGLIFKKTQEDDGSMVVHGLTTAASVWLSAAVGIACGGELYFAASFGTALMMLLLRFGPRSASDLNEDDDDDDDDDDHDGEGDDKFENKRFGTIEIAGGGGYGSQRPTTPPPQNRLGTAEADQKPTKVLIFKNNSLEYDQNQISIPGLQISQRSSNTNNNNVDKEDGSYYTVTGESIENGSLTTETTPMLYQQYQQQQQQQLQLEQQQQQQQQQSLLIGDHHQHNLAFIKNSTRSKNNSSLKRTRKKKSSQVALASIV